MKSNRIIAWGLCSASVLTLLASGCVIICDGCGDGECRNLRAEAKRTDELTAPLADITVADVSTNIGTLRIEAADVTEAAITAKITVKAKTQEEAEALLEEVRISTEPSGGKLTIKAIKPSGFGRNSLTVDFDVKVPKQLGVHGTTNVGDIRIAGIAGDIVARTDVGKIDGTDLRSGKAEMRTNVGAIKVAYAGDAPVALRIEVNTNVGDIDFSGPEQMSAKFSAVTNVGSINTNREMKVRGLVGKSLEATVDGGEGRVAFRTNVGSIRIR
jgi:hypothetical protein